MTCYTIVTKAHGGTLTVKSELRQAPKFVISLLSYLAASQSRRYGAVSSIICMHMQSN